MISITETKTITVRDANGNIVNEGDAIRLRIKTEDIVCRFVGLSGGYFVTQTIDRKHENKYRQGSIVECVRIEEINYITPIEQAIEE